MITAVLAIVFCALAVLNIALAYTITGRDFDGTALVLALAGIAFFAFSLAGQS